MAMTAVASPSISLLNFSPASNPSKLVHSRRLESFPSASDRILTYYFFSAYLPSVPRSLLFFRTIRKRHCLKCSASKNPSPYSEISSTAKIRSEVLSPFRSVRIFFYLTFIASGTLGGLIAITQLVFALVNPSKEALFLEILKGLGIDVGAVLFFALLYNRENKAKNAQIAKLSREERLSQLKLRVDQNKVVTINDLRGTARLVILAGPVEYINESFKRCEEFSSELLERGVLVVPFAFDGNKVEFESRDCEEVIPIDEKKKRLWQLRPVNFTEWNNYLSLRMDGRVRGSGVGYPPWNALVAQLPPVKGFWSGILDGMDGKVL